MDFSDVLLTVDFDRTMTAPDSTIPERNLEAIRYFIENGGAFTVNTGRSLPMALKFAEEVPVNAPLLLYNGSAAYDLATGELSQVRPLELHLWETIREVREMFPDMQIEVQGVHAHYRFWEDPMWDRFCENYHCPHAFAQPGDDLGPFLKFAVYGKLHRPVMEELYTEDPEEITRIDEAERRLNERFGADCAIFRSNSRILDIQTRGVSKGNSARMLQKRLGKKILVCVGDGENDVTMLDAADYAFCPGDAVVADRYENVCICAQGAVADVIYEKIPEILKNNT